MTKDELREKIARLLDKSAFDGYHRSLTEKAFAKLHREVVLSKADEILAILPAQPDVSGLVGALEETLDALGLFIPSPMCRDCSDENGTCPNSRSGKMPCDAGPDWASEVRDRARQALNTLSATPEMSTVEACEREIARLRHALESARDSISIIPTFAGDPVTCAKLSKITQGDIDAWLGGLEPSDFAWPNPPEGGG